jgi:hypothetical protein
VVADPQMTGGPERNRLLEVLASMSFLSTVVLISTLMPSPRLQGAIVGLGVVLLVAFGVYLRTASQVGVADRFDSRVRSDGEVERLRPDGSGLPERRRQQAPVAHPRWERRREAEPVSAPQGTAHQG